MNIKQNGQVAEITLHSELDTNSTPNRTQRLHFWKEDGPKGLDPVNNRFWDALYYHSSLPAYNEEKLFELKWFNIDNWISSTIKPACGTVEIHKGFTMWLLPFFIEMPAAPTLSSQIAISSKPRKFRRQGLLATYGG